MLVGMAKPVNAQKLTRREQAAATRERILRAGLAELIARGFVGARMADIAGRAGVAVQTVYFTFHTKGELLQACFDLAVLGPDRLAPEGQPFYADVLAARSGWAALAAFARGNTAINERSAAIKEVAEAATHDPDAAAVVAHSEKLRREGYSKIVEFLAERFDLRAGIDISEATDVMLVLGSGGTYLALRRCGWSDDRMADWLADALADQLLPRPGRRRR